jgi:hypothetical protein
MLLDAISAKPVNRGGVFVLRRFHIAIGNRPAK